MLNFRCLNILFEIQMESAIILDKTQDIYLGEGEEEPAPPSLFCFKQA